MDALHIQSDIKEVSLMLQGGKTLPHFLERERTIALQALKERGQFTLAQETQSPFAILLSIQDNRMVFDLEDSQGRKLPTLILSLKPYRRLIKDYFMMIESYETFRKNGVRAKLEAIDMGRRGLHNEGAEMMMDRLSDKIQMDLDTARAIFTLVCSLQTNSPALV